MSNSWPSTPHSSLPSGALRLKALEALLKQRGLLEQARSLTQTQSQAAPAFQRFRERYQNDLASFVETCVRFRPGHGPAGYQLRVLRALPEKRRVAVRAPHGAGKTAIAAWVILHAVLTADDVKVPVTASAWRQLTKFLFPEIHKWAGRLRWDLIGRQPFSQVELLTLALKLGPTCEAFAVASNNPALIEGAHADKIVYVFDEAKAIPDGTWDAAEGAFSTGEAYALAISTPGEPSGRFYQIHARKAGYEDWFPIHITKEEAMQAGRISAEWVEQRKRQWGESSSVYQNRVEGEFASQDEESVIPLAWIEAAIERWHELAERKAWPDFTGVGVDVARSGEDKTVYALRHKLAIRELRSYSRQDTMTTVGQVKGILDAFGGKAIVDVIGMGAGVIDRLREQRYTALAFNAGAKAEGKDRSGELGFVNLRSYAWWHLREMLDPAFDATLALPPDDLLIGDLTAPKWRVTSGGKIEVESKDDIKKRLERSTDFGDAVVMVFSPETDAERGLNVFF